jgi:glyoxylase-like metal-dependent hydrolase (beta-lactamase superfamily II)
MDRWNHEKLSDITYKVVENDPYGQYPFLYVILGADKCILIDTGTGNN